MPAAFLLLLGALGAAEPHLTNNQLHGAASAAVAPTCNELSTSLGSHMVLQRAPEHAVVFGSVCGKLAGAKSVSVVIDGAANSGANARARCGAEGVYRICAFPGLAVL